MPFSYLSAASRAVTTIGADLAAPGEKEAIMDEQDKKNESQQDRNWRQLEARAEKAESELTKWRSLAIEGVAHRAGYDVKNGVTKLVLEKFSSQEFDAESLPQPDDFSAFATELDVKPNLTTNSGDSGDDTSSGDAADHESEQQMDHLQGRANDLLGVSTPPVELSSLEQQAAEAEAKGDYATSITAKFQMAQQTRDK